MTSKFKSKFQVAYESLFSSGSTRVETRFWRELFLLDVDSQLVQSCIYKIPNDQLMMYSTTISGNLKCGVLCNFGFKSFLG
jgi:hypothetical protein